MKQQTIYEQIKDMAYRRLLTVILTVSIIGAIFFSIGLYIGSHNRTTIQEARIYTDILKENTITWEKTKRYYLVELELSQIRADIYKNQIKNLLAANNGLKTIINKDPEIKTLIE